jgi:hypothetical protein
MGDELRGGERRRWRKLTTERAWTLLKKKVEDLVNKYVPTRRRRNHIKPAWMTREVLKADRRKQRLAEGERRSRNGGVQRCREEGEKLYKKSKEGL